HPTNSPCNAIDPRRYTMIDFLFKQKTKRRATIYPQLVISLTHSHTPRKFSFQSVTFPSPQLTAKILPARLQETRQTTSGNLPATAGVDVGGEAEEGSSAVFTQGDVGVSFVQMRTVLSFRYHGEF